MKRSVRWWNCTTRNSWAASSSSAAPRPASARPITAADRQPIILQKGPLFAVGLFLSAYNLSDTVNADAAPLFMIAGPTAVGKSPLAVMVAERCSGEIVSADAFQIYRGLDILTAKPAPELRARVPHHLIGEIPLQQSFDVAQFLRLARERIAAIRRRG